MWLPAMPLHKSCPVLVQQAATTNPLPVTQGPTQQEVPQQHVLIWLTALGVAIISHTHAQLLTPHCTGKDWLQKAISLSALVLRGPLTTFLPWGPSVASKGCSFHSRDQVTRNRFTFPCTWHMESECRRQRAPSRCLLLLTP